MKLSNEDKETIISLDETPADAVVFTYNRAWQRHLETRLGLRATMNNGAGGREYRVPKSMVRPPRAPRRLSDAAKKNLAERLRGNRSVSAQNPVPVGK